MVLAMRMEMMLMIALVLVVSDHGNFLLRKSLMIPFPNPRTNEYMVETKRVMAKFSSVFSSLKTKKKKNAVASDIQSNMMMLLYFIVSFLGPKLGFNKSIKNNFSPNRHFL